MVCILSVVFPLPLGVLSLWGIWRYVTRGLSKEEQQQGEWLARKSNELGKAFLRDPVPWQNSQVLWPCFAGLILSIIMFISLIREGLNRG